MTEFLNLKKNLPNDWNAELTFEFDGLQRFLNNQLSQQKKIYPSDIFKALSLTPFAKVRVVLLGQDPYHGPNQAHGLAFSVPDGVPLPPSLRNIYKELKNDLLVKPPKSGNLAAWATQGVLLLNTVLTVTDGLPGSHGGHGWEVFTDEVIRTLNEKKDKLVFVLWGNAASKKRVLIDEKKHFVISSVHPSPLSAYRGFFGSKPFSKINALIAGNKIKFC